MLKQLVLKYLICLQLCLFIFLSVVLNLTFFHDSHLMSLRSSSACGSSTNLLLFEYRHRIRYGNNTIKITSMATSLGLEDNLLVSSLTTELMISYSFKILALIASGDCEIMHQESNHRLFRIFKMGINFSSHLITK